MNLATVRSIGTLLKIQVRQELKYSNQLHLEVLEEVLIATKICQDKEMVMEEIMANKDVDIDPLKCKFHKKNLAKNYMSRGGAI